MSDFTAHVCFRPALTWTNVPDGGVAWPNSSDPQQMMGPKGLMPQPWSFPSETVSRRQDASGNAPPQVAAVHLSRVAIVIQPCASFLQCATLFPFSQKAPSASPHPAGAAGQVHAVVAPEPEHRWTPGHGESTHCGQPFVVEHVCTPPDEHRLSPRVQGAGGHAHAAVPLEFEHFRAPWQATSLPQAGQPFMIEQVCKPPLDPHFLSPLVQPPTGQVQLAVLFAATHFWAPEHGISVPHVGQPFDSTHV